MAATESVRNCGGYIGDLPDEGVHLPAPISTSAEAEADDGGTRCEVALDGSDRSFRRPIPAAVALGRFPLVVAWKKASPLICRVRVTKEPSARAAFFFVDAGSAN